MPLGQFTTKEGNVISNRGTNGDGSLAAKYCSICYRDGKFVEPSLTLDQMVLRSTNHMIDELGFPAERAQQLALSVIPTLQRWRSVSKG